MRACVIQTLDVLWVRIATDGLLPVGDTVFASHSKMDEAIQAIAKLREGGACGEGFSAPSCTVKADSD